jgi:hypothetical protein
MNTLKISSMLECDKRTADAFEGVYASDELPRTTPTEALYVVNTDPSDRPGEHWMVVYFDEKRRADYFDSFGLAPSIEDVKAFLDRNSVVCKYNRKRVQNPFSDACGHHCIFFAVHRCVGFDMNAIVNMYTEDDDFNDDIVKMFVNEKLLCDFDQ